MKILHVVASYLPAVRYGGTIVSVHGLCRALAARGHDVEVFTTSVDGGGDSPVAHGEPVLMDGVAVSYFRSRHLRRLYYAPELAIALRARTAEMDVVHTHAIYLWPMWAAAAAARRAGVAHVISPRGMLEKELIERKTALWKSILIGFVERRHLEAAAAIHVTSQRERDEAQAFGFALPPVFDVPNGVDVQEHTGTAASPAIEAIAAGPPFALFLGRINWKKGLDRLVASLAAAPTVRLVIAGYDEEGYWARLAEQAAATGVADRVLFTGPIHGADKAALLHAAALVVLPSYSENFGNVVLEAMAAGRAVVVTPEVGMAAIVERTRAGWVVDGAAPVLGARLEGLIRDPEACRAAGERGRQAVAAEFTWDRVAQQMEAVYATAIARQSAGH